MRHLFLSTALLLSSATAQVTIFSIPALPPGMTAPSQPPAQSNPATPAGPVQKVEIQEVEVTSPVSTGTSPTVASEDVGEVSIPLRATDKDGRPVAGVSIDWEVKNTGKAPVYVISSQSGGAEQLLGTTIAPGETWKGTTTTGPDGITALLLNAAASTAAALKVTGPTGEVKNLREAAQTIDWIGE
ncbi:hypothetical protein DEIPH_ctg046orf0063 [Deinococcus phoenicis]|uniref:DUF4352 domain-containing protein n=1 Tax=Deinococcus phoenicis TaxID=1476583 RepID=A0A016QNA4_9DEIO|nr:hypothetical protein [Deinococcus phoenicis]EYB67259.1 hypothetical protein DEIPH_ctg046orf0063 [Deinococcus phoenicis]